MSSAKGHRTNQDIASTWFLDFLAKDRKTSVLEPKTKEDCANLFLFYNFINSYFIFSFVCFSCNKLFFSRKYLFAFPENSVGDKLARFERISGESLKWPEYKSFLCFLLKVLLMAFSRECIHLQAKYSIKQLLWLSGRKYSEAWGSGTTNERDKS